MKKKLRVIGIFVLLLVVLFSGCSEQKQQSKAIGNIVDKYTTSNNNIANFVIFVNLTIKNTGDSGDLTAWAYVRQGNIDDEKSQTLFFKSEETKIISFAFSEKFVLGSSWFYDAGIS